MFKMPKREYTAEFKDLAVRRVKSGETVGAVARDLCSIAGAAQLGQGGESRIT